MMSDHVLVRKAWLTRTSELGLKNCRDIWRANTNTSTSSYMLRTLRKLCREQGVFNTSVVVCLKFLEVIALTAGVARIQETIPLLRDVVRLVESHNLVEVAVLARVASDGVHPLFVKVDSKMLDTSAPNDGQ